MPSIEEVAAELEREAPDRDGDGRRASETEGVTTLELFFDLVFVFAITQVTQLIADQPDWQGLVKGLLVLALIWWTWAAYAWLTDLVSTERDGVRIVLFVAMGAMFVVSLAVPGAFEDEGLVFAGAYLVVRLAHIALFAYAAAGTSAADSVRALLPSVLVSCGLIFAAALFDGVAQGALFAAAIAIDYVGGGRGIENWRLRPSHFAERHGLIVIIAFGESIVATGIGAETTGLGAGEILAAICSIAIVAALWWAYFDVVALVAERRLADLPPGRPQNSMARDSYSYLHLVLIAGIVLLALGAKKTLEHVDDPLKIVPAVALCGGLALYLAGQVAFRYRNLGSVNRQRLVVAVIALALIPYATAVPALVAIATVAVLICGLISFEAIRFAEARRRIRASV